MMVHGMLLFPTDVALIVFFLFAVILLRILCGVKLVMTATTSMVMAVALIAFWNVVMVLRDKMNSAITEFTTPTLLAMAVELAVTSTHVAMVWLTQMSSVMTVLPTTIPSPMRAVPTVFCLFVEMGSLILSLESNATQLLAVPPPVLCCAEMASWTSTTPPDTLSSAITVPPILTLSRMPVVRIVNFPFVVIM